MNPTRELLELRNLPQLQLVAREANCVNCSDHTFATCVGTDTLNPGTYPDSPECRRKRLEESISRKLN